MHKASSVAVALVNLIWKFGKFTKVERFKGPVWLLFSNKDWHDIPEKKKQAKKARGMERQKIANKQLNIDFNRSTKKMFFIFLVFVSTCHITYLLSLRTHTYEQSKNNNYCR